MMEVRDGKRVFTAAPNPSAVYVLDDPDEGGEIEVDLGNIPLQPLLDVIDYLAVRFSTLDEVQADAFRPSEMLTIVAMVLPYLNEDLTPDRVARIHPSAALPFAGAAFSEQIMPQVRAAFESMQLKNG